MRAYSSVFAGEANRIAPGGVAISAGAGQGFIAPADVSTPAGAIRLASPANTDEYARTLYSALRDGDAQGLTTIAIIQPSGDGLAIAIRDRLMRASKGR